MEVALRWSGEGLHFIAQTEEGHLLEFDSPQAVGGTEKAARPMAGLLSAMMACFSADIVSILRKKRRTLHQLQLHAQAQRREEFPKVFTHVKLHLRIVSPDAVAQDIERAIELSCTKYCSAMAMFRAAGTAIDIDYSLERG